MAIAIDENIMIGVAALVFIPVFLFCIKMIMKVGSLEQKIDQLFERISSLKDLDVIKTQINLIEYQLKELKEDMNSLMRKVSNSAADYRIRDRDKREESYKKDQLNNNDKGGF